MRVAILGATSQIANDLVQSMHVQGEDELVLYARRPHTVDQWLIKTGLRDRYTVADFRAFAASERFDVIVNFVGVSNPAQATAMGAEILEVTLKYDALALGYLHRHPSCRYIFLSSGAAYGASFDRPVDSSTNATYPINRLQPQDWYGIAKFHAECRHRASAHLSIVDVRIFNYFSHTQDMAARFLITDILRAIRGGSVLQTSSDYMVRDYLHPSDFHQLIAALMRAPAVNTVVDCYTKAPIDKPSLLAAIKDEFGLRFVATAHESAVNATGGKPHYYSLNRRAADFGYSPSLTSLQGVLKEMRIALLKHQEMPRLH